MKNKYVLNDFFDGMDAADSAVHNLDGKIDDEIKTGTDKYEKNATAVQNAVDEKLRGSDSRNSQNV